jgi:hypothetical protein
MDMTQETFIRVAHTEGVTWMSHIISKDSVVRVHYSLLSHLLSVPPLFDLSLSQVIVLVINLDPTCGVLFSL